MHIYKVKVLKDQLSFNILFVGGIAELLSHELTLAVCLHIPPHVPVTLMGGGSLLGMEVGASSAGA